VPLPPQPAQIPQPPADLAAPCAAGPDYPEADTPLEQVLDVVAQREIAAAVCRARYEALLKAWPR
jgi:hypothetical protein